MTRLQQAFGTILNMRHALSLTILLALLWLAISGVYKPPILLLGAGSIALVVWLSHRMNVVGVEHNPALFSWRLPVYWVWLTGQIIKANMEVATAALVPKGRLRPTMFYAPLRLKSSVGKVTYGNSITLTPGTVTLQLEPDQVRVHALLESSAEGVKSDVMQRRVEWLERRR